MADKLRGTPPYEKAALRLTAEHIAKAIAMRARGEAADRIIEWRDTREEGLVLRITKRKVTWYLRLRNQTIKIGEASTCSVDQARQNASETKNAIRRGRNGKAFAQILAGGITIRSGDPDPEEDSDILLLIADDYSDPNNSQWQDAAGDEWTWKQLTDEFLAYKEKNLRADYFPAYSRHLRHSALDKMQEMQVRDLKFEDLLRLRERVVRDAAPSTAHRIIEQTKNMLTWAWREHSHQTGMVELLAPWWNERLKLSYKSKPRVRQPTIEEMARTLVVVERLGEDDPEQAVSPGTIGALWAVVLTAQRTGAIVALPKNRIHEHLDPDRPNWKVLNWKAQEVKGGGGQRTPHSLPLPENALAILDRYHREADPKSPWLFPNQWGTSHVTQSALNLLFSRLRGRRQLDLSRGKPDRPGKPGPKPKARRGGKRIDLFEEHGIRPWTPHDARRTLTSFLESRDLGGAASAILDHRSRDERTAEEERMQPVTKLHYLHSQRISLKTKGMEPWVKAVIEAYEAEKAKVLAGSRESVQAE